MNAPALAASALSASPLPAATSSVGPGSSAGESVPAQAFADALGNARRGEPPTQDAGFGPDGAERAQEPPSALGDAQAVREDEPHAQSAPPAMPDAFGVPPVALAFLLAQSALSAGRSQDVAAPGLPEGTTLQGAAGAVTRAARTPADAGPAALQSADGPPRDSNGRSAPQSAAPMVALDVGATETSRPVPAPSTVAPRAGTVTKAPEAAAAMPIGAPDASAALRVGTGGQPAVWPPTGGRSPGGQLSVDPAGQASSVIDAARLAPHQTMQRAEVPAERFASPRQAESLPPAGIVQVVLTEATPGTLRERDARHTASPEAAVAPGLPASGPSGVSSSSFPATTAPGGAADFAGALADQISWWLGQKTQGAELTVQGPGGAPVSVSVQVQGNEAHVAFRSDQAQARQLIGDSLVQLERLLDGSGLVLGQVSVGAGSTGHGGRPAPDAGGPMGEVGGVSSRTATLPEPSAQTATRPARRGGVDVYA